MANIDKINGISGFQGTDLSCGSVSLYGLRNFIDKVFVSSPNGTSYTVQTTSGANSPFATLKTLIVVLDTYFSVLVLNQHGLHSIFLILK